MSDVGKGYSGHGSAPSIVGWSVGRVDHRTECPPAFGVFQFAVMVIVVSVADLLESTFEYLPVFLGQFEIATLTDG